jgi:ABC-2 type transport system permease protein
MRKEFRHIIRDKLAFSLTLISPLMVLVPFGYSFLVEVTDVSTAVLDLDNSVLSASYLEALDEGDTLTLNQHPADREAAEKLIKDGKAKIALIIPDGFADTLGAGRGLPLEVLIDGSEPHAANVASVHINDRTKEFISQMSAQAGGPPLLAPVELAIEALFNPDLKPINGVMPGMIGMSLSLVGVAVCAALTREKERGTFEGLVATPIRRSELLIGKLIPYVCTGMLTIILCVAASVYGFGVPFQGNLVLLFVLSFIFLFALMAYALLLSLFFQTQQAAMMVTILVFMIPPFFLSGMFIPVIVMPWWIRIESMMFPVTPFVIIMRGLFLQDLGLAQLWFPTLVLVATGIGVMVLAILLFRKRLQTGWLDWMLDSAPLPAAERKLLERWLR